MDIRCAAPASQRACTCGIEFWAEVTALKEISMASTDVAKASRSKGKTMPTTDNTRSNIDLQPPLTIRHAGVLREAILAAWDVKSEVVLNVPADTAVDLSFVQLVESARIYAE